LLGRLSGFSIGTKFFLGLRHNQRRGLRVRRRAYKLHRRQSGGGKQQQTKFCHDSVGPRKKSWQGSSWQEDLGSKSWQQVLARAWQQTLLSSSAINGQALGRIVAGSQCGFVFIWNA
jgi:hypothetical protein